MANRGITNNNLLNVKRTTDRWQGASVEQPDPVFISFDSPKWGIRCACRIIILYQDRIDKGTITLRQIINTWAPPNENHTNDYLANVSSWSGIMPDTEIDVNKYEVMFEIIQSMIREEVGLINYDKNVINEGLRLAGIAVPVPSMAKNPVAIVSTIAATAGTITPIVQTVSDATSTLSPFLNSLCHSAPYLVGIALIGGAVWLIIRELQKNKVQK